MSVAPLACCSISPVIDGASPSIMHSMLHRSSHQKEALQADVKAGLSQIEVSGTTVKPPPQYGTKVDVALFVKVKSTPNGRTWNRLKWL